MGGVFFPEFEWSFVTYLIIHSKYQKPLRQTNLERAYYQLIILETSAVESVFLKCLRNCV